MPAMPDSRAIARAFLLGLDRVRRLDPKTGQDRWRFQTDEHVYPGPTVSNGVLYFGGGGLRAIR